ncbi:MAG: PAS domain S-box protein [Deltaproteobacteria bacterium]|nr:PAS domain S-box protein [Deltaproteobacteria bacterium]
MSPYRNGSVRDRQPWWTPIAVFVLLSALTGVVWWQQVSHQRLLLTRHTEDVCTQASRRAEVFFASHLSGAEVFAKRWATHEGGDFSRLRFEEFGSLVLEELPGYHAVGLLDPKGNLRWTLPPSNRAVAAFLMTEGGSKLLAKERQTGASLLSRPVAGSPEEASLFGMLPLSRDRERLGYLLFEFRAQALFDELFGQRIRAEFAFTIDDGKRTVFRHAPDMTPAAFGPAPVRSTRALTVWNRSWRMTVVPRPAGMRQAGWTANLLVPSFGLALSLLLSLAAHLLALRVGAYRRARDAAVKELGERRRAEEALRASEARYRSVFDSATDGLVVLNLAGDIQEANPAACAMHGYEKGALGDMHIRDLIAQDCHHKYDEFRTQIGRSGVASLESLNLRQDGTRFDVEVHGAQFTQQGEPALLAILVDVSERKAAQQVRQRLSRQVLVAQEEERGRLSRDLHDGLGQTLTALRFELDWLDKQPRNGSPPARPSFQQATQLLASAAQELRRMCKGLRPPLLDDLGLEPAVRQLVNEFGEHTAVETDLAVRLDDDSSPLPPDVALCAYRVLQEALTNVGRHAQAQQVDITIGHDDDGLVMSVYDDGRGFDPADEATQRHFGLAGMRERATLVDGTIELRSAPDEGTRVVLRIPRSVTTEPEPS